MPPWTMRTWVKSKDDRTKDYKGSGSLRASWNKAHPDCITLCFYIRGKLCLFQGLHNLIFPSTPFM